jgi:hypothetical protein
VPPAKVDAFGYATVNLANGFSYFGMGFAPFPIPINRLPISPPHTKICLINVRSRRQMNPAQFSFDIPLASFIVIIVSVLA